MQPSVAPAGDGAMRGLVSFEANFRAYLTTSTPPKSNLNRRCRSASWVHQWEPIPSLRIAAAFVGQVVENDRHLCWIPIRLRTGDRGKGKERWFRSASAVEEHVSPGRSNFAIDGSAIADTVGFESQLHEGSPLRRQRPHLLL